MANVPARPRAQVRGEAGVGGRVRPWLDFDALPRRGPAAGVRGLSRDNTDVGRRLARAASAAIWCAPCDGGVAEWFKARAWKVRIPETVSRVRIPLPPPTTT